MQNQHTAHTGLSEEEGGDNDGHNGVGVGRVVAFRRRPAQQPQNRASFYAARTLLK